MALPSPTIAAIGRPGSARLMPIAPGTYTAQASATGFDAAVIAGEEEQQARGPAIAVAKRMDAKEVKHKPGDCQKGYNFALKSYLAPDSAGFIRTPEAPGLGVEIDWDYVRANAAACRVNPRSVGWEPSIVASPSSPNSSSAFR